MSDTAKVNKLPKCDFPGFSPTPCSEQGIASYDFKTSLGAWANGCTVHYKLYRRHMNLGTGKGQKLILNGS